MSTQLNKDHAGTPFIGPHQPGDHDVLVDGSDTTPGFLDAKLSAGSNVSFTIINVGGDEKIVIAAVVPAGTSDHKVLVDGGDTTAAYLGAKLAAGAAIALTVLTPGGNEQIEIAVSGLSNAQVDAAAAIAGTKISPNFGSQNILTSGTVDGGAATFTSVTDSGLGTGVVHSNAGGLFSSSLIVNADVNAAAAIAGTKISPNFGSQNILTSGTVGGGAATFTSVTDSGLGTGVVHSSAGGLFSSSLIVNADVDAAAAIAGTKIAPDFGSQVVTTTGSFVGNSGTAFIRLGLVAGSGAGVASAASQGQLRVARGSPGFEAYGRNNADTADILLLSWDSTSGLWKLGGSGTSNTRIQSATEISQVIGSTSVLRLFAAEARFAVTDIDFTGSTANPTFSHGSLNSAGATGTTLSIKAQATTSTGTNVAGALAISAGDSTGAAATSNTGGKTTLRGGDASAGTTNIGGDLLLRAGTGSTRNGNIAINADPASWQSMAKGLFVGNDSADPTGDPAAGGFLYARAGALVWRGSGGTITTMGAT